MIPTEMSWFWKYKHYFTEQTEEIQYKDDL